MKRVLVVDDSRVSREHIAHILSADPALSIAGLAADGAAALEAASSGRIDIIVMDVEMPIMDGFEATKRIMADFPLPIVMISAGWNAGEVGKTFRALEVGALAILEKPPGPAHQDYARIAEEIRRTVKAMANVRVSRRSIHSSQRSGILDADTRKRSQEACPDYEAFPGLVRAGGAGGFAGTGSEKAEASSRAQSSPPGCAPPGHRLVVIGASTGGPAVLCEILSGLPKPYPFPIVIVQHISAGFIQGLADWLGSVTGFTLKLATDREEPLPNFVYLAPDGAHLGISPDRRMRLFDEPPIAGLKPAVNRLFSCTAEHLGKDAIGVLLTGMGQDGATGLAEMRLKGSVTVAQDRETSIVYGMPGEAVRRGAAQHVLSPAGIIDLLTRAART